MHPLTSRTIAFATLLACISSLTHGGVLSRPPTPSIHALKRLKASSLLSPKRADSTPAFPALTHMASSVLGGAYDICGFANGLDLAAFDCVLCIADGRFQCSSCCTAGLGVNQVLVCAVDGCCVRVGNVPGEDFFVTFEPLNADGARGCEVPVDAQACGTCALAIDERDFPRRCESRQYLLPGFFDAFDGRVQCAGGPDGASGATLAPVASSGITASSLVGVFDTRPPATAAPRFATDSTAGTSAPVSADAPNASTGATGASGATTTAPDSPACFPAAARVALSDGSTRRMDELRVGDVVSVGRGRFSAVFGFTHRAPGGRHAFRRVRTACGAALTASRGHYVHTREGLNPARDVKTGDFMYAVVDGEMAECEVVAVEETVMEGLYNPQTLHGDVVVDNVLTSTYTTAVEPAVAHALLAPLRAVYRAVESVWDAGKKSGIVDVC